MKKNCTHCNQEYEGKTKSKYCSLKCLGLNNRFRNTKVVECANCKINFNKRISELDKSKSGFYFCTRGCKDNAQKIGGIKEIMPDHYGTRITPHSIKFIKGIDKSCCTDCGEKRKYLLVVHHIDSDRTNNDTTNLEIVCSNCHLKRHLDLSGEEPCVNYKCLTPRDKLFEY